MLFCILAVEYRIIQKSSLSTQGAIRTWCNTESGIERAEYKTMVITADHTMGWMMREIVIGEGGLMHFTASDLTNCNVEKREK